MKLVKEVDYKGYKIEIFAKYKISRGSASLSILVDKVVDCINVDERVLDKSGKVVASKKRRLTERSFYTQDWRTFFRKRYLSLPDAYPLSVESSVDKMKEYIDKLEEDAETIRIEELINRDFPNNLDKVEKIKRSVRGRDV